MGRDLGFQAPLADELMDRKQDQHRGGAQTGSLFAHRDGTGPNDATFVPTLMIEQN